tara:strand:+ start:781 stop:1149 length:369 start_codon:yes stop_codon:yes gene_type:complete
MNMNTYTREQLIKIMEYGQLFLLPSEDELREESSRDFEVNHPMQEDVLRVVLDMRESEILPIKIPEVIKMLQSELNPFLEKGVRDNQRIITEVLIREGYQYDRRRLPYSEDTARYRGWWPRK